jgi:hypothetical protein
LKFIIQKEKEKEKDQRKRGPFEEWDMKENFFSDFKDERRVSDVQMCQIEILGIFMLVNVHWRRTALICVLSFVATVAGKAEMIRWDEAEMIRWVEAEAA